MKYFISDCTLYMPSKSTLPTAFFRPTNREFSCGVPCLTTEGRHLLPLPLLVPAWASRFCSLPTAFLTSSAFGVFFIYACASGACTWWWLRALPRAFFRAQTHVSSCSHFRPHHVGLRAMSFPVPPEPCTKPDPQKAPSMMFIFFPNWGITDI